jgi:radical SAM superfamily enzyme YgiQ (UPF0313 family)
MTKGKMHYEGPIYRPPSEADSLLVQATVGCPHNRCTFCMVYKNGPRYKVRKTDQIKKDLLAAKDVYGPNVKSLFFPAGNTIAMRTDALCEICSFAREVFPNLIRITVYGSSPFIHKKGLAGLKRLKKAGLSRIHVGLESGDDIILEKIKKGTNSRQQIQAGKWVMDAGIELSLYVILGIGGKDRSCSHAKQTAKVLNKIAPDFIRLRTFLPKINTPLLEDVQKDRFEMLGPHGVLKETEMLVNGIDAPSYLTSDHYTNYLNIEGKLPCEKELLIKQINTALKIDEESFRPFYVGTN